MINCKNYIRIGGGGPDLKTKIVERTSEVEERKIDERTYELSGTGEGKGTIKIDLIEGSDKIGAIICEVKINKI